MKKSAQEGIIDPKLIIGGIVILVVVFFLLTGNFKFSASINNSSSKNTDSSNPASTNTVSQQSSPTPEIKTTPKTYQNDKYNLSLEYPANWSLKENPAPSYIAGFFSPKEDTDDSYDESLGVKAIDTSSQPNLTLQEMADAWENQTQKSENSFVVTGRTSSTLSGENAKEIIYTFEKQGTNGKGMARMTLKDNTAYIFQYNATEKSYDKFLPDIEAVLASVKF